MNAFIHCAEQIDEVGFLIDCFVTERKHQMAKQCCIHIKKTSSYERSVMARILQEELRILSKPNLFLNGLRGATTMHGNWVLGRRMYFDGVEYYAHDYLYVNGVLVLVEGCGFLNETCYILVHTCTFLGDMSKHASRWRRGFDGIRPLELGTVATKSVSMWAEEPDGIIIVLH